MKTPMVMCATVVALLLAGDSFGAADATSGDTDYEPPTQEEMAPLRVEFLTELAKIHEPPEMAKKPMQVRKLVSPKLLKADKALRMLGEPEEATHQQRATAMRELLETVREAQPGDSIDSSVVYGAVASIACLDAADPQMVIDYASNAIDNPDVRALRAKMYLKAGDRKKSLDDLEALMAQDGSHSMAGGGTDPRKESSACGWSIADLDALGEDPRALAAKGFYLSSFIGYGAEDRKTVSEADIRELYARSAKLWHSPIPHVLEARMDGLGSEQSRARVRCIRGPGVPTATKECAIYDEKVRQQIRNLTMALVIDPKFVVALAQRADRYLNLAQAYYLDGKPSRQLFEFAIADYAAALAAGGKDKHTLYCDQALALASIGRYKEAAAGYLQGMKYARSGIEDSPFVYQQLAGLFMRMGKYAEAAEQMTNAITYSDSGMKAVIFLGGLKGFRTLYPEYDGVPDEILAEAIRRRYASQLPKSWDAGFIAGHDGSAANIPSSVLPELYVTRGDAYMKLGRREMALADYRRVKSDAWGVEDPYLPRHTYFTERGTRNYDEPEPWPPKAPVM